MEDEVRKSTEGREDGTLPFYELVSAGNYLHWLLPVLRNPDAPVRIAVLDHSDVDEENRIEMQSEYWRKRYWSIGNDRNYMLQN